MKSVIEEVRFRPKPTNGKVNGKTNGKTNGKAFEYISPYRRGKELRSRNLSIKRYSTDLLLIALGVVAAGFGLRGFLLPNNFVDGGAVGISLLIEEVTGISVPLLLILVNTPFVILGYSIIGKGFALKTAIAILCLSLVVAYLPYPEITHDKLLIAIFGGFFLGLGIGLAVRGGGVIDGTEVLAISLTRKFSLTVGDTILIINSFIFIVAANLLSVEAAMYSILTYIAASKTVDFVVEGIEEYTGVTIISVKASDIRKMIVNEMRHGVTIIKGDKGYGNSGCRSGELKIIYTVITRLEISKLTVEVEKIDPHAFVVMSSIKDTRGGMIRRRIVRE